MERGQQTFNRDFASGTSLLSMEESAREVTWSSGSRIDSDAVAKAFKLEDKKEQLKRSDAGPTSGGGGVGCGTLILLFVVILIILLLVRACMGDEGGAGFGSGAPQQQRLVRRVFQWRRPQVAVCIVNNHFSGEHHGH